MSGNLATNLVLDEVGTDEVAAVLADAGCSERTTIVRGIEDYPARDAGIDNLITADDMARLVVALADGRLAGPEATAACEQHAAGAGLPQRHPGRAPRRAGDRQQDGLDLQRQPRRRAGPGARDLPPVGLAVLVSAPGTEEEREAGIARVAAAAWAEVVG